MPPNDDASSTITGKIKPAGSTNNAALELRYCYYEKMEDGWYYEGGVSIKATRFLSRSEVQAAISARFCRRDIAGVLTCFKLDVRQKFALSGP